jgi:Putative phage holin Dp-1
VKISSATYDKLKYVAVVLLPAIGTLYFAIAQIWGLPNAEEVVGTITAIDAFLGLLLQKLSGDYHDDDTNFDGVIKVTQNEAGAKVITMEVGDMDPYDIENMKKVTFKVDTPT